ncbi:MAG TPA: Gfo/Idh/MocA family oxidoreductase, partial [bacterium]|nr:Gfo/Idh/MocA family oxidoreductase [bacterium]
DIQQGLQGNPQAVFICSPTDFHLEQAKMAVLGGADVMVEKPLSTSVEGVDGLEALASEHGKVVMVAHCFRFHEGLKKAKSLVHEGVIGRLLSIRASVGEYIPDVMPDYRNMYISKLNGVYELMHDIDLALWFADQPPVRVFGIHGRFSDVGMKSPDMVEILIEFKERCLASIHLDFFQRARRRQIDLLGTKGTILVDFAHWDECLISLFRSKTQAWTYKKLVTDRDDMFREENRLFLQACITREPSPLSVAQGRLPIQIIDAVKDCQQTHKAMDIVLPERTMTLMGSMPLSASVHADG